MKKHLKAIIVIVFLSILAIVAFVDARGSFIEYKELGENYISVFRTNLVYKYAVLGVNFVLIYIITYFAGRSIKKGLKVFFDEEKKEMPKLPNKSIAVIIASIVSIIQANAFTPQIMQALNQAAFVETDGIFNLDISFFMFILPVLKMIINYGIEICIGLIIYSAVYYILAFNKFFDGVDRDTLKNSYLIKNIIKYVKFIAIDFSVLTLFRILDIVYNNFIKTNSGLELVGAGFIDITIKVVGNAILAFVIIIAAFMAASNFKKGKNSKALKNMLFVPGYMVMMFVVILGFDLLFVNSNKYDKEKKYIEKNIAYTQKAYGINSEIENIEYSGTITSEEIEKNENIINNAAIISKELALQNLNENQNEKGYYTYRTAGIYKFDDKTVYLSPKEISNARRTYNSKTFEYTHGYGIVLSSATQVSENGDVEYFNTEVNKPQIYYGLETNNAIVVNNGSKDEYDYTDSKGNEYTTTYEGDSGVRLAFLDRLVLALKTANPNLAFSGRVNNESDILINRNIIQRAKKALSGSNIIYDDNPYMVIDSHNDLYWVLDAYTISENYPYSTFTTIQTNGERKRINYIRNSIKVIISAYDGNMKFYIIDDTDPIALTYKNSYPKLFENKDEKIPEDISSKFVYPEFLYNIQSSIIEEYHNTKPEVLYRSDDSWSKATYITTQNNKTVSNKLDAYYTSIKQEDKEKIALIQIYTPNGKQNLNSYLLGTVESGKNKLKICRLSSDENILGLTQLDNKISQDEKIGEEIQKLDVTGAKVTKNMMVIPVNNTLLYIEQVYQTKQNESKVPKLKKVIVASGNKVAIGDNLKEAVENISSRDATNIDTYTTEDIEGIIQSIIKANNNLTQSMDSKDLELIGSDIKKLQELINMLEKEKNNQKVQENVILENTTVKTENVIEE